MITHETLTKFCSQFKNEPRLYLKEPFAWNGKVYATNGHILIRTEPNGQEYPEPHSSNMKSKHGRKLNMAEGCEKLIAENPPGEFIAIPEWDRTVVDERECRECEGHGYKVMRARFGTYPSDELEVGCDNCDDAGKVRKRNPIVIGATSFDSYYLRLIESLPNPQISIPQRKQGAVPFRFDGGIGLLMPMNV